MEYLQENNNEDSCAKLKGFLFDFFLLKLILNSSYDFKIVPYLSHEN